MRCRSCNRPASGDSSCSRSTRSTPRRRPPRRSTAWTRRSRAGARRPSGSLIEDYHAEPDHVAALAASIAAARAPFDHLLFSFHGIPRRYAAAGDPYGEQCQATARLVAARLALPAERWSVAFQSRVGRRALARALHGRSPARTRARGRPAPRGRLPRIRGGLPRDARGNRDPRRRDIHCRRRRRLRIHPRAQRLRRAGRVPRAPRHGSALP